MVIFRNSQLFPLCFAVFVSMLGFGLIMPLLPIYARDFGATGTQLGFLTASFAIARLVTTFPGGWIADRSGRKIPIILGLFAYSVVMTLYGFSQDANQLILLRGLQGMASGVVWPIISTMVVETVVPKDRGKAIGLYEMMHFLGMVIGPGLGGILAEVFSISIPFFVCGILAFFSAVLVAVTVQETFSSKKDLEYIHAKDSSDNGKSQTISRNNFTKVISDLTPYVSTFVFLCVARFILAFSNSLMQPVLSVYANEKIGISEASVGMLFTAQGIVTMLVTLPLGTFADEAGRKPVIVLGMIVHTLAAILIVFSGGFWFLLLVMMMRGFGRAASNPSITAILSGLVPISKRGKGMGIFSIFQNVGLVLGATVGGFLYEFSSLESPFITCAGLGFIGVLVVLLTINESKHGLQ